MVQATLKIERAKYIISMDPERRIIADGSVLIKGQRITHVGKAEEMDGVEADRVIDGREMVVTPGFSNGHIHISYAHATRGIYPDDLSPGEYFGTIFKIQQAMTEEEEYLTSLLAITELLKYGTTCLLDPGTTKHLDACLEAYAKSGCRIIIGRSVSDATDVMGIPAMDTASSVSLTEETIHKYDRASEGRVRAWAMPFSAETSTPELLQRLRETADRHGTGMTMHQSPSREAMEVHKAQYGVSPVERLEELGVLGPNVLLAHMVNTDEAEIDSLVRTGAKVVMCPTAALKQGAGVTSAGMLPEMLDRGVCVGLGTDAANNSNLVETMRSLYLAATLFKDARQSTRAVSAEQALEMATIGGANTLGLGDEVGSIEPGKRADLVLFDTRRAEWRTLFNPVNNLVYSADGRSVHTVIVDGNIVVEEHKPTFVDEWELIQKVQVIGEDLMKRTGVSFQPKWPIV